MHSFRGVDFAVLVQQAENLIKDVLRHERTDAAHIAQDGSGGVEFVGQRDQDRVIGGGAEVVDIALFTGSSQMGV